MFTKSLIAAGLAGLVLCTQPASAQSAAPQTAQPDAQAAQLEQRLVHYTDLDLSSAKGQARLDTRLRSAAAAVCATTYGPHPLNEAMEARRCYRKALTAAYRQVASIGNTRMVSR